MVSRWNVVITGIYAAKKPILADTDTGTLSRIAPGTRYTLRVNWPGFKGLIFILSLFIQSFYCLHFFFQNLQLFPKGSKLFPNIWGK